MTSIARAIRWLRHQHRAVKCAILLVAAWAPLLLAQHPLLAGLLMGCATGVFLIATHLGQPNGAPENTTHDSA